MHEVESKYMTSFLSVGLGTGNGNGNGLGLGTDKARGRDARATVGRTYRSIAHR